MEEGEERWEGRDLRLRGIDERILLSVNDEEGSPVRLNHLEVVKPIGHEERPYLREGLTNKITNRGKGTRRRRVRRKVGTSSFLLPLLSLYCTLGG